MRRTKRCPILLALAVAALAAPDALAGVQRTFVGSYGQDTWDCSVMAPCRTFGAAAAQTLDGGEIIVTDAGEYGAVTLTQSISIVGPGDVHAGVAVAGGAGITINAPGKVVRLEGLSLEGRGGDVGVRVEAASLVLIQRCSIAGFSDAGIRSSAGAPNIFVHDTTIRDNGVGIVVEGAAKLVVERGRVEKNTGAGMRVGADAATTIASSSFAFNGGHGLVIQPATGTARAAVVGTLFAENAGDGIHATAAASTTVKLSLSTSELRRNSNGLAVDAGAGATIGIDVEDSAFSDQPDAGISASNAGGTVKLTLSGNTVVRNGTGVVNSGALVESRGNNTFNYNGTNGSPLALFPGM